MGVVSYTDILFDEEGDDVGDMGTFKHMFCSCSSTISW